MSNKVFEIEDAKFNRLVQQGIERERRLSSVLWDEYQDYIDYEEMKGFHLISIGRVGRLTISEARNSTDAFNGWLDRFKF